MISCNDEDAGDCIQTEGEIINKEITVAPFEEIIVYENIELFVIDSNENKIVIEGGENLINDIKTSVTNNVLEVVNNNNCFFDRDFKAIKVYVYNNKLNRIRNASNLAVQSIGTLNYTTLNLISENFLSDVFLNSGDFILDVNLTSLSIVANGPSTHKITGNCGNININFAGANPRFEGRDLILQNASIFARSTNDIILNVTNEITGNLFSTGDVILVNKPNTVSLNAFYTGRVIENY